jgi:hypothetical protein
LQIIAQYFCCLTAQRTKSYVDAGLKLAGGFCYSMQPIGLARTRHDKQGSVGQHHRNHFARFFMTKVESTLSAQADRSNDWVWAVDCFII